MLHRPRFAHHLAATLLDLLASGVGVRNLDGYMPEAIADRPEVFSEARHPSKWFGDEIPGFKYNIDEKERRIAALEIINDFPFWKGELPFRQSLCQYYERAADLAEEILTGEKKKSVGRPRKLI